MPCADELTAQCKTDYGLETDGVYVTDEEWEEAGGLARVIDGEIFLGKTDAEKLAEAQEEVRNKRNALLNTFVDPVQSRTLYWAELSEEKQTEWKNYRLALLDVPEQEIFATDPASVEWPEVPEA